MVLGNIISFVIVEDYTVTRAALLLGVPCFTVTVRSLETF